MFQILDGRNEFFQWDLNRQIKVNDKTITQIHFCNKTEENSLVCDVYELEGVRVADVPNILLQQAWPIRVYAYCKDYTKVEKIFKVNARSKPTDYVYTETEVATWNSFTEEFIKAEEERQQREEDRQEQERERETAEGKRASQFEQDMDAVEKATAAANVAADRANVAADWAHTVSIEAEKFIRDSYTVFANALTGVASGKAIKINDLSPLQEYIDIRATAETEVDFNTIKAKAFGANNVYYPFQHTTKVENGIHFTDNGDGSITIKTDSTGATARTNFNIASLGTGDYSHLIIGENYTISCKCDKPQNITGGTISFTVNYYKSATDAGKYAGWLSCQTNKTATKAYPSDVVGISTRSYISVNAGVIINEPITVYPMLEVGTTATAFESFVEPIEYNIEGSGEIYYFVPVGNTTTVITDNAEVNLTANYTRDINKVIARLENAMAMATMGGAL